MQEGYPKPLDLNWPENVNEYSLHFLSLYFYFIIYFFIYLLLIFVIDVQIPYEIPPLAKLLGAFSMESAAAWRQMSTVFEPAQCI